VELNFNPDVVYFEKFRWFGGLTRDFWAENGKRKMRVAAMAIKSVASKKLPCSGFLSKGDDFRGAHTPGRLRSPSTSRHIGNNPERR
jgi:hypothetical protein